MQEIEFASIASCKAEWFEFGGSLGSGGGSEVVIVDPLVLDDLEQLFETDAERTRDVGTAEPELQNE